MSKQNMDEFAAGVGRSDLDLSGLYCPVGEHDFDWLKDFMDDKLPPIEEDLYKEEQAINIFLYWGSPRYFMGADEITRNRVERARKRLSELFHVDLEDAFRVYWSIAGPKSQKFADILIQDAVERKLPQVLPEELVPEYEKRVFNE